MKTDEMDIDIMRHIRDGRKSLKKIADAINLSGNSARKRLNKMMDEEVLEISGLVDPTSIPGHMVDLVGVKLSTMELVKRAKDFKELRSVVSGNMVPGR